MCLIGGMRGGPLIPYPVEYLVVAGLSIIELKKI